MQNTITTLELQRLVFELWEHAPQTRIRFRLMGQMWMKHYVDIVHITASNALVLRDKNEMKHVSINDVMAFELESPFQSYKRHNHYEVKLR